MPGMCGDGCTSDFDWNLSAVPIQALLENSYSSSSIYNISHSLYR